jgi:hypothetical protein
VQSFNHCEESPFIEKARCLTSLRSRARQRKVGLNRDFSPMKCGCQPGATQGGRCFRLPVCASHSIEWNPEQIDDHRLRRFAANASSFHWLGHAPPPSPLSDLGNKLRVGIGHRSPQHISRLSGKLTLPPTRLHEAVSGGFPKSTDLPRFPDRQGASASCCIGNDLSAAIWIETTTPLNKTLPRMFAVCACLSRSACETREMTARAPLPKRRIPNNPMET